MSETGSVLEARGVCFAFPHEPPVLNGAGLTVGREVVALTGASGSGKSTFLLCLAGILAPAEGSITIAGRCLDGLTAAERARVRRERIGMVFQFSELVAELTLVSNVALPLELLGMPRRTAVAKARELLDELGIGELAHRYPAQVSGGQAQRVAVARALVHDPAVVLADEPTGALDARNGEQVLGLLLSASRDRGAGVVLVTHDTQVAAQADAVVRIEELARAH